MADASVKQTQPSTSEDTPSPSPSTLAQDLEYPKILLEASFDSLLTHSFPSTTMASVEPDPSRVDLPASLSESWTSISDAEYSQDEDLQSEITDAESLLDIHSTDDVHSLRADTPSEDEVAGDHEIEDEQDEDDGTSQAELQASTQSKTPMASRHMPDKPSVTDSEIVLDESESIRTHAQVHIRHVLTYFSESDADWLQLDSSSSDGYAGTLHVTLSDRKIPAVVQKNFRLLLFGPDYAESTRPSVVSKIADALVASTAADTLPSTPSRYHVVPDSFGPGCQPTAAEVIPVHHSLDVQSYQSAEFLLRDNLSIKIASDDPPRRAASVWNSEEYAYDILGVGWERPDLAIVLVSSNDSHQTRESANAMTAFAMRHHIPMMIIRIDKDWNAAFSPLGLTNIDAQLCIEKLNKSDDSVLRTLPLDLDTFLNINPAQLGRHLAYLVHQTEHKAGNAANAKAHSSTWSLKTLRTAADDTLKNFSAAIRHAAALDFMVGAVLMAALIAVLSSILMLQDVGSTKDIRPAPAAVVTATVESVAASSVLSSQTLTVSNPSPVPLTITSNTATKHLEAEVVDKHHIVLRCPSRTINAKHLTLNVTRDGKYVGLRNKVLFPGVISMELDPLRAYGNIDVCLSIAKPPTRECVSVDLGPQFLSAQVLEMIMDKETRQERLAALYRSFNEMLASQRPHEIMKEARERMSGFEEAAREALNGRWAAVTAWQANTQAKMGRKVKDFQDRMEQSMRDTRSQYDSAYRTSKKSIFEMFDRTRIRDRVAEALTKGRKKIPSEKLAKSQKRARRIFHRVRRRLEDERRRHR